MLFFLQLQPSEKKMLSNLKILHFSFIFFLILQRFSALLVKAKTQLTVFIFHNINRSQVNCKLIEQDEENLTN